MIFKDTKITYFIYSPYECAAVEEYLEKMAENGWLLQGIKGPFFKFRRIESKKIKFSLDVLNKVSIFDHKDTETALEYREYCTTSGWTYICQIGKVQVFYTEEIDTTISIHTDEKEKFKSVFKASLYDVSNKFLISILFMFNIYIQLSGGSIDFLLSSNLMILSISIMFFLVFVNMIKFINFSIWAIKAKLKLKENKFIPYNTYRQLKFKNILFKIFSLMLLLSLLIFSILDNPKNKEFNILIFTIMLIPIIISIIIKSFINKKRYSKNTNMIITIISSITSIFLILMLIGFAVFHTVTEPKQSDPSNIKFNLTLIDFGYKENSSNELYTDFNKSILAQRVEYSNDDLDYKIFESEHPWVIRLYENRLFNAYKKVGIDLKQLNTNLPKEVKVYLNTKRNSFILVTKNKIIDIRNGFNNISDDDLLNVVYTKLLS